jgi:hypothetical protein
MCSNGEHKPGTIVSLTEYYAKNAMKSHWSQLIKLRYADEGSKLLLSFSGQWREMSELMTHRATNDVE